MSSENPQQPYDVSHVMVGIAEIKGIVNGLNIRMANYERDVDRMINTIEAHEARIKKLEDTEQQRQGAATTIRVLWAVIGAIGAGVMYVVSNFLKKGTVG